MQEDVILHSETIRSAQENAPKAVSSAAPQPDSQEYLEVPPPGNRL